MFNSLKKMFSGSEKEREKILAPVEGKVVPLRFLEKESLLFLQRGESWRRPAVF